ncbi:MAG: glycosyltransferase family 1 protein [Bacteroidota bacterium]
MKIGFDAKRLYNNFTGLGNYSRNLLLNLAEFFPRNEYVLYTSKVEKRPETEEILENPAFDTHFPNSRLNMLWRSFGLPAQLRKEGIELYHGLSNEIPSGIKDVKTVVTIHDLIYKIYPQTYSTADRLIYDTKFAYACKHADAIVAISETTRNDIIRFYGIPEEKISVIYQSCHPMYYTRQTQAQLDEVRVRLELPKQFMLSVGSVIERKNLMLVAEALRVLRGRIDVPLIVVGSGGKYKDKVQEYLLRNNLHGQVIWMSNLSDNSDLQALYQLASVFVYPSRYEGFGIPVAEALLSGTPVITSNVSCLPEAAGPHAELIDPDSPTDLAAAIYRLLNDDALRKLRSESGLKYALRKYDRKKLTTQLMNVYKEVRIKK